MLRAYLVMWWSKWCYEPLVRFRVVDQLLDFWVRRFWGKPYLLNRFLWVWDYRKP